jgi:peptide chain release factor 1
MSAIEQTNIAEVVDGMIDRYREIESSFQDPSVASTSSRYASLMKEYRRLSRIVQPALKWADARKRLEEAESILSEKDGDEELQELARMDATEAKAESDRLFEEIRDLLLTEEEFAERDVVMEIRAGTGGEEASLFTADLFRMYQRFAESRGWRMEVLTSHPTDLGGFKEIIVSVEGEGVFRGLRFESGGHRVQRVPETEAGGRIHTSACTVAVLPEPEEVEINLKTEDLKIDTFRASGTGGQKVNKTSSAVRMTHIPTGIVVSCQDEKSQHKNRSKALKIMKSRLFEVEQKKKASERSEKRRSLIGSGDRSERIRTFNYPQNRVTDHRIKKNFSLQAVIAGDLTALVAALEEANRAQRLAQLEA